MKEKVIENSMAIAEAVKLCKPDVIAAYPITPQTHIVEHLSEMVSNGELDSEFVRVESEHSALSVCIGAEATGARTFTATNSQGLAYMSEMLFVASGMKLPLVMAVTNRALSAPLNIWNDHSDTMAQRDSGWIQLFCENSQESFDTIIQAYKIAEISKVPVMVCVDGFTLSHLWEPVKLLSEEHVRSFLPAYSPSKKLDTENPATFGTIATPIYYQSFKMNQQKTMLASEAQIKEVNREFGEKFGRHYGNGLVESYHSEDSKKIIVAMGSICGTIKETIDQLREKRSKVGLLRIKAFRPFPEKELAKMLDKAEEVIVIDRAVSFGSTPPLYTEIRPLVGKKTKLKGIVTGLGGKDITPEIIENIISQKKQKEDIEWL